MEGTAGSTSGHASSIRRPVYGPSGISPARVRLTRSSRSSASRKARPTGAEDTIRSRSRPVSWSEDGVPMRLERLEQLVAVVGAARLHRHRDLGLAEAEVRLVAVVFHVEHVGAQVGEALEEGGERAGPVRHPDPEAEVPARGHQAVLDDPA